MPTSPNSACAALACMTGVSRETLQVLVCTDFALESHSRGRAFDPRQLHQDTAVASVFDRRFSCLACGGIFVEVIPPHGER